MRARATPLPLPPERHPYIRVKLQGETYVLRVPSLPFATRFLKQVTPERRAQLDVLLQRFGTGQIGAALLAAPDALDLVAALIGVCWADPEWELESDQGLAIEQYGAALQEELHEAGWKLSHLAAAGMALITELVGSAQLDAEVRAQAAFFLRPTARSTESASRSSSTSSAPTEAAASES